MFAGFKYNVHFSLLIFILQFILSAGAECQVVIDHNCTDITKIPQSAVNAAKTTLHIAYGHTSHGSQITDGMTGLVEFANNGGKGLSFSTDIFVWNNGGTGGALDLHDYAMGGDCGYYPDWVNNTISYLNDPSHSDVNVIMWSWCGQVEDKYRNGTLDSEYLSPMSQLETDYPEVTFVYMTGHVDHWDDADNKAANQYIRNYCITNNKVLYDFADIESYDPDGTYYEFPHDNCDYYASAEGEKSGNWALEWQDSHIQGQDWYNCGAAHTQPLNSNLKAYAAWWLWAVLAGWDETTEINDISFGRLPQDFTLQPNYPNPFNGTTTIHYYLPEKSNVEVVIYNLLGERIITLINYVQDKGAYSVLWKGLDEKAQTVSSGVYIYVLRVNNRQFVNKMTLLE